MIKNNEGELQEEENGQYEWNEASQSDADDLIRACSSFGFMMAVIITRSIFAYARQATVLLQCEEMSASVGGKPSMPRCCNL